MDNTEEIYIGQIFLDSGTFVKTEVKNAEEFIKSLTESIDTFYNRTWFKSKNSVVRVNGNPICCIAINRIRYFTVEKKSG